MNRLQYWCRAKTRYNLHSPFMYRLYSEVLFARLPMRDSGLAESRRDRCYRGLIYKFRDHFDMTVAESDDRHTMLSGSGDVEKVMLINRPHRDKESESQWYDLCDDSRYQVSIDLYDTGVLIANRRLHRQHFILR